MSVPITVIPEADITLGEELGRGAFGVVIKATVRGRPVCVKVSARPGPSIAMRLCGRLVPWRRRPRGVCVAACALPSPKDRDDGDAGAGRGRLSLSPRQTNPPPLLGTRDGSLRLAVFAALPAPPSRSPSSSYPPFLACARALHSCVPPSFPLRLSRASTR